MEKINLSDLLEPEHMDPVKRIALIRIVDDDGGVRESYKFLIESEGWRVKTYPSAEGLTTKAVSDVLGIAERTAQVHVAHVCSKLGVENAVGVAQIIARLRARGVLQ